MAISIILETAVQDNKVMQDFELESLSMRVDHSQKVKATPIESDYSSKDCVNLLSSTAVSRIITSLDLKSFLRSLVLLLLFQTGLSASVPAYIENWNQMASKDLIRDPYGQGGYLSPEFQQFIDKDSVHFVLEIGSRDAIDALDLSRHYKAPVCAFECNPQALDICYYNKGDNPNVTIVPLACWNETKLISFFPIVESNRNFNLGASSLYKMDLAGPDVFKQGEIEVQATRLDEWLDGQGYDTPDLICIDAQGATLPILQGLGNKLSEVKYIIAESEFVRFYEGEALYPEIVAFMKENGFKEATKMANPYFGDVLFVRNDLLQQ
jgi:FkbM family methyltransferase